MNLRTLGLILAASAGLACTVPARAGGIYLQVHGGWSTLNLDDVNATLDAANAAAGESVLDNVHSGLDAGLHVGYDLTAELGLSLGYARLWAASKFSRGDYSLDYDLPADLFELSLDFVPAGDRKVNLGAGATVGMIRTGAALMASDPVDGVRELAFEGSGFLFAGYGMAEAELSAGWRLFGQAGLRHAVIGTVKIDERVVFNPDSLDDKFRINYGGFFLRLGIRFRP